MVTDFFWSWGGRIRRGSPTAGDKPLKMAPVWVRIPPVLFKSRQIIHSIGASANEKLQ